MVRFTKIENPQIIGGIGVGTILASGHAQIVPRESCKNLLLSKIRGDSRTQKPLGQLEWGNLICWSTHIRWGHRQQSKLVEW